VKVVNLAIGTRKTTVAATNGRNRKSGIDPLGDVPWGTHICQFYQGKRELIGLLVPYFKAGLENNEFCLWITADLPGEEEAEKAMGDALPDFCQRFQTKGQMGIGHAGRFFRDGSFNLPAILIQEAMWDHLGALRGVILSPFVSKLRLGWYDVAGDSNRSDVNWVLNLTMQNREGRDGHVIL
jgi:hypothetical protein